MMMEMSGRKDYCKVFCLFQWIVILKKQKILDPLHNFSRKQKKVSWKKKKKVCLDSITWQEATVYSPSVDCSPCDYGYWERNYRSYYTLALAQTYTSGWVGAWAPMQYSCVMHKGKYRPFLLVLYFYLDCKPIFSDIIAQECRSY